MEGSRPRPSYGRVKSDGTQGQFQYGRLVVHGWAQISVVHFQFLYTSRVTQHKTLTRNLR